jgi:hypothetical protein
MKEEFEYRLRIEKRLSRLESMQYIQVALTILVLTVLFMR